MSRLLLPAGGWCPEDSSDENGPIPEQELMEPYARIKQNLRVCGESNVLFSENKHSCRGKSTK